MLVLGVDIGGTFTDLMLYDTASGSLIALKVPSVPGREWEGLERGFAELGLSGADLAHVVHGTTVATNAVIQGRGARVLLVTTRGMRDVLEIGRGMRNVPGSLFHTHFKRAAPLVPRDDRLEVDERMGADGTVVRRLDEAALQALALRVRDAAPEAAAVCFINAYANPAHEEQAVAALAAALPGVPVFASHAVSPEFREYERFCTTVINAGVSPILDRYLGELEGALRRRGFPGALYVMASNGGTLSRNLAGRQGARTILSGPVGGVRGAITVARTLGRERLITLDMGGTSTDVALVEAAAPGLVKETVLNGLPIRLPQLRIVAVGAGGGSIAAFDEGGALRVGPHSAGAEPGPVCYGQGGEQPTVTDANLLLGRLDEALLGGRMRLERRLAAASLEALGRPHGMDAVALAEGIVAIAIAHMSNAIREVSIQEGHDPREFALVAFGGAGPMHACLLAEELGMEEVIVPPHPGNVSAYGLLASDLRLDGVRTWIRAWGGLAAAELRAALEHQAGLLRAEAEAAGWPLAEARIAHAIDMRYQGQAFEVMVALPGLGDDDLARLPALFEERHVELYGHAHASPLELVSLRASLEVPTPFRFRLPETEAGGRGPLRRRPVCFAGRFAPTPIHARSALGSDGVLAGPAVIDEAGSTTVLPAGWRLRVAGTGALLITRENRPAS